MTIAGMTGTPSGVQAVVNVLSGSVELFDSPIFVHQDDDLDAVIQGFCKMELVDTVIVRRSEILEHHPNNDKVHLRRIWREVYRRATVEDRTATWVLFVEDRLRDQVGLPREKDTREAQDLRQQFLGMQTLEIDIIPRPFDPSKMS